MSGGCTTRFAALVDRAFVRGLSARQRRRLRDHLASCESCRARWERLAIVERALGGPQLDDVVINDIRKGAIAAAAGPRPRRARWFIAFAGAMTAAGLALLLMRSDGPDAKLAPRGHAAGSRTPGVRLFCVARDEDLVRGEVHAVSIGSVPNLRCRIRDDLQLAYTTPDREELTMVAFARLPRTTILYAPMSDDRLTLALRTGRVDEVLDWSIHLDAEHHAGTYDVIVRFFDQSVQTRDAIAGRVEPVVELHATLEVEAEGGSKDAH